MKYRRRPMASCDPDMTPMIDISFQLVIFFMLTLNFAQVDQDERIKLPSSELAKPSETPYETPIMLQLTEQDTVLAAGDEVPVSALKPLLLREREMIDATKGRTLAEATVIIRADRATQAGKVQQVIQIAQQTGFEKFILRAREEFAPRARQEGG